VRVAITILSLVLAGLSFLGVREKRLQRERRRSQVR
jgi:hypothetical protein